VIEAVRASTCYPFAFEPVFLNGRRLVDGGLSSNLPVFLFTEEYRQTRIPALAFDLSALSGPGGESYDLGQYGSDLLSTALEASDELLRQVLRGVYYIPVQTPPGIGTLDFDLSRDHRKRLFDAGHKATTESLTQLEPLKRAKMAGDQLQKQLWVEFGPPQFFTPVLHALAKEIEGKTLAKNVRAHIMLPSGRPEATRIVTYHYGMEGDTDVDLELPENAGCSGKAWSERAPALADLAQAATNPAPWGMTPEQHAKVPASRKSMLSVPIHPPLEPGEQIPPPPVGTLSVDSTTPLEESGWLERTSRGPVAHFDGVRIMMNWAYIVHRLLT
jgi:NTE family protein